MFNYIQKNNEVSLKPKWKLLFTFLGTVLASLAVTAEGGLTLQEFIQALQVGLASIAAFYLGPVNSDS